jgi:hypothetical protein
MEFFFRRPVFYFKYDISDLILEPKKRRVFGRWIMHKIVTATNLYILFKQISINQLHGKIENREYGR